MYQYKNQFNDPITQQTFKSAYKRLNVAQFDVDHDLSRIELTPQITHVKCSDLFKAKEIIQEI